MNLDGSAAWRGRSADELLDEFLEPFQEGPPGEDIVHLLAINDGRLLEWIEGVESRRGGNETPLTKELYDLLERRSCCLANPTSDSSASTNGRLSEASRQIETESRPASWSVCWIICMEASKPPRSGRLANHVRRRIAVKFSERHGSSVRTDSLVWSTRRFALAPANGCSRHCRLSICVGKRTSRSASCARL